MKSILERIKSGEILVSDGAMGSFLFEKGLKPGQCPELLNLTEPKLLEEIASLYLQAGADLIQTNTFGASPLKLANYNLDAKTTEINKAGVEIVKKVTANKAYISGSCGPSARILEPYGDITADQMYNNFEKQLAALIDAGVNVICIETMTDLQEALIAVKAAKAISPEIPVMATMTFDKILKGYFTVMGVSIESAVKGLTEAGADIIGSNCGNGIDTMLDIAKQFKKLTDLPILIQSNAGIPQNINGQIKYPESPSYFAERMYQLIESGISIIGGCCGTTPDHVKEIRIAVNKYSGIQA